VCVFLGRAVRAPQVRRVERKSTSKLVNIIHIRHRDEVEPPITDWLQQAYDLPDKLTARGAKGDIKKALRVLKRAGKDNAPLPGDELPPKTTRRRR
jgi:hypothetical protein